MEHHAKESVPVEQDGPRRPRWVSWARWALLVVAAVVLLWQLGSTLLLLALALLMAAALSPIVSWLESRRVPRVGGTLICMLILLSAFAGGVAYLVPIIVHQSSVRGCLESGGDETRKSAISGYFANNFVSSSKRNPNFRLGCTTRCRGRLRGFQVQPTELWESAEYDGRCPRRGVRGGPPTGTIWPVCAPRSCMWSLGVRVR